MPHARSPTHQVQVEVVREPRRRQDFKRRFRDPAGAVVARGGGFPDFRRGRRLGGGAEREAPRGRAEQRVPQRRRARVGRRARGAQGRLGHEAPDGRGRVLACGAGGSRARATVDESSCTVFGTGRGPAAGRDVDIPRAAERTKIDGRRRSRGRAHRMCGPTVFAGRIEAPPRGATWILRGGKITDDQQAARRGDAAATSRRTDGTEAGRGRSHALSYRRRRDTSPRLRVVYRRRQAAAGPRARLHAGSALSTRVGIKRSPRGEAAAGDARRARGGSSVAVSEDISGQRTAVLGRRRQ